MSYNIETRSVTEFVTDAKIKLPRFQRKSTWNAKQNFELAISIFQDYPVGVVIINEESNTSWLLDGRQRRTALRDLRANPDLVYDWARKYIGFVTSDSEDTVQARFWDRVNEYLQHEESEEEQLGKGQQVEEPDNGYEEDIEETEGQEKGIKLAQQLRGLNTLLDIIKMVHQKRNDVGKWERIFDLQKFVERPSYAPKRDNYKIDPVKLRAFLLDCNNQHVVDTKEDFMQHIDDQFGIRDGKENAFKLYVEQNWECMQHIIKTIATSEQIFTYARVGVILLKNVTPLDAQNIFSRINSGGTQLKAEELLSAKPFWNVEVSSTSSNMATLVKDMYTRLGVEVPTGVVRWDYGATLLSRIKDQHLLFDEYKPNESGKDIDMTQVTLGFKLISSYYISGMSAVDVSAIEKERSITWGQSIDELIDNVNRICEILLKVEFFKYLKKWNKSIFKMMGSAIVLEFITILLRSWEDKGCPTTSSAELNLFIREAKCLFDRLVYEYAVGAWRGSGDHKMSSHIKNWRERVKPVPAENWVSLMDSAMSSGDFNGTILDIKHLTPIICYQFALQRRSPEDTLEETSEVDHIYPQALLANHSMIPAYYKDALFNLSLLSKDDNINKKDKALNEIKEQSLRESVSKYTGIALEDFDKYSDVANINELRDERAKMFREVFGSKRTSELAN